MVEDDDGSWSPQASELDEAAREGAEKLRADNLEGKLELPHRGMVIADKWQLLDRLGAGSFAEVYAATHLQLGHSAAIKFPSADDDAEAKRRLLREARILAGISSKRVVRASDFGELPNGMPYIVMELAPGKGLRRHLMERTSLVRAVKLAEELLEAVAEVHAHGVVHGDIKPENVVIGEDGDVRLLDFGLARTVADEPQWGGTPAYMAPEMLLDRAAATRATDLYAVGVVLYELLTGRLPRGNLGMKPAELLQAWTSGPEPNSVQMYRHDVPDEQRGALQALDELVMQALARDPSQRPKSATAMLKALRVLRVRLSADALGPTLTPDEITGPSAREAQPTQPQPVVERRRRARPIGVIAAALGVVATGLLVWWKASATERSTGAAERGAANVPTTVPRNLEPQDLEDARGGVLIAALGDPSSVGVPGLQPREHAVNVGYEALCKALGGDRPPVEGVLPVSCRSVPFITVGALRALAEQAGVKVVVLVDANRNAEIEVRSTMHRDGHALLARLDGLPLPADPEALAQVAPVLEAVVGMAGASGHEIGALDWRRVGARWGVLAEWLRLQQGHQEHQDFVRREQLMRALERMPEDEEGIAFYRDLAALVWAASAECAAAEPTLGALSTGGSHDPGVRVAALLGRAACRLEGGGAAVKADEAEALLDEAFALAGDDPCVRVAALGSISRIDRWKGDDALWEAHAARLPGMESCEPAMWSQGLAVRGDALVDRERWCDAARTYAQAYAAQRTRLDPLLAWAEYDWRCRPEPAAARQELFDELRAALTSASFTRVEQRVSVAYLWWWLTREPADAQRVMDAYATVPDGVPALIAGVGSDLEREICDGRDDATCSWKILVRPKQPGDDALLRRSLGLH